MEILRDIVSTRARSRLWKRDGLRVAFVPTMGALHAGHTSLVRLAREHGDRVVVSIFVNPTQFGPGEDYRRYPRTESADLSACDAVGVDAVFLPSASDMYPEWSSTFVEVGGSLTAGLCGASRPGHFRGVATVVTKLFHIVEPDAAVFGQKDAQQLAVIRRMVRDLDIPVQIVPAPIVREADGLAMSSRNAYLSPEERAQAVVLQKALRDSQRRVSFGETDVVALRESLLKILAESPLAKLEYAEIVDTETLEAMETVDRPALAALAMTFGKTRLIDNALLVPTPCTGCANEVTPCS
jgi:pantoate--beta-alanine ligase